MIVSSLAAPLIALFMSGLSIDARPYYTRGHRNCDEKPCNLWVYQTFTSSEPARIKIFNPNNPSVPIVRNVVPTAISASTDRYLDHFNGDGGSTHFIVLTGKNGLPGAGLLLNYKFEFSQSGRSSNIEIDVVSNDRGQFVTPKIIGTGYTKTTDKAWFEQSGNTPRPRTSRIDDGGSIGRR